VKATGRNYSSHLFGGHDWAERPIAKPHLVAYGASTAFSLGEEIVIKSAAVLSSTTLMALSTAASAGVHAPLTATRQTAVAPSVTPPVLKGTGARVLNVRLPTGKPLVVTATHNGSSNFIVRLVGPSDEYLFNEIGAYSGQIAVPEPEAGRYRVSVDADGAWTLKFAQPRPSSAAIRVPGTLKSRGSRVVQIRATTSMEPIVTGVHSGKSNFIVRLIGIGSITGSDYLFNEIGRYRGQTIQDSMPKGNYLLAVQADGAWSVKFTR
jgi:hypothetical protein